MKNYTNKGISSLFYVINANIISKSLLLDICMNLYNKIIPPIHLPKGKKATLNS